MLMITSNKHQRLLLLNYVGRVAPTDLASSRDELRALLAELPAEFRLLADFTQVEFVDPECMTEMGRAMDVIAQHGVSLIVRVMPDPAKDIGLNILTVFHYPRQPRIITCPNLAEALHELSLW
jgi:hypothetical protein